VVWEGGKRKPTPLPDRPARAHCCGYKSHRALVTASEAQLRKGDRPWGGSVERNCDLMDKNRIEGAAEQGKRAGNREALMAKVQVA
jgi:hypothetical protein